MVIANGENCAEPNGIDKPSAQALFECGVDVITTGNHVYRKSSVYSYLDDEEFILRPLNFPSRSPGHGECIIKINGYRVLCLNVLGSAYMDASGCPFEAIERALNRNAGAYDIAVLDIHAEATGEKLALAYDFSDRLSACFGTHTHIQTNDARIIKGRLGYVTDIGMVGARDSILGVKSESVIYRLKTKMLSRFDFAEGEIEANGAIFEIDTDTGRALSCQVIKF
jgi:metallophosphoesterase (TIGR00282 family)